jgi:hypothetical protein
MKLKHDDRETRELLLESISSDVTQFLNYWKNNHQADPVGFPLELTSDEWMEQFWAWMEGRI